MKWIKCLALFMLLSGVFDFHSSDKRSRRNVPVASTVASMADAVDPQLFSRLRFGPMLQPADQSFDEMFLLVFGGVSNTHLLHVDLKPVRIGPPITLVAVFLGF